MAQREQRVTPLELCFDLVLVYAITQVTLMMSNDPTWDGIARGLLVLAALWWAWTGYAWLTNSLEPEEGLVRLGMFAAMAAMLVMALAVPGAFGSNAVVFGVAYLAVRLLHLALYALAGKRDPDLLEAVVRFAPSATIAPVLILVAARLSSGALYGRGPPPDSRRSHPRLISASRGRRSLSAKEVPTRGGTSMRLLALAVLMPAVLLSAAAVYAGSGSSSAAIPLKDAKLNIEHNATDRDTGFQGFIDSEGWRRLDVRGPGGHVLAFEALGSLGRLGMTELFFETVEPENAKVPIKAMLAKLPEGRYAITGPSRENGKSLGRTSGTAWLTHDIPAGPKLVSPKEDAKVPVRGVVARWQPVSKTITGEPVQIVAYQLIIEKDVDPHPHVIGKLGLSMYLPPKVTSIAVPDGFLEPRTAYAWEVLAIERSGNQTLSSSTFRTR